MNRSFFPSEVVLVTFRLPRYSGGKVKALFEATGGPANPVAETDSVGFMGDAVGGNDKRRAGNPDVLEGSSGEDCMNDDTDGQSRASRP